MLLWPHNGKGGIRFLNGTVVRKSNMEDARLFRDNKGKIRMLFNRHYNSQPHYQYPHGLRVALHVAEVRIGSDNRARLTNEQVICFGGTLYH